MMDTEEQNVSAREKQGKDMHGIPLKEIREAAGISQRKLGEGLCDRGVIRMYEESRGEPEKLFADALIQRGQNDGFL